MKRLSLTINLPSNGSPGGLGQCIAKEPTAQSGIEDSVSSMWRGGGSGAPGSGVSKVLLISLHILSHVFPSLSGHSTCGCVREISKLGKNCPEANCKACV